MVPGCPPGLFTKQFAEFAPMSANVTNIFGQVTPSLSPRCTVPSFRKLPARTDGRRARSAAGSIRSTAPFHPLTAPHLPLPGGQVLLHRGLADPGHDSLFGDPTGDGWFKMFEFFEVPSQMIGAVGPVAQGTNFDWLRQDTKPGLINLNLIIDEEVFFSVFGSQSTNFNQQLLSFDQLPNMLFPNGSTGQYWTSTTTPIPLAAGTSPIPLVVTATLASGAPAAAYAMNNVGVLATDRLTGTLDHRMKASFAQFLSLRHGGSGFVFGYGGGTTGQNTAVQIGNTNAPATPNNPIPADRPFHSLSYPDINYTIMRPAALPPSAYTDPQINQPTPPAWPPNYAGNYTATLACEIRRSIRVSQPPPTRTRRGACPDSSDTRGHVRFCCRRPTRCAGCSSRRTVTPTTTMRLRLSRTTRASRGISTSTTSAPASRPRQWPPAGCRRSWSRHRRRTTYSVNDGVVNLFWVQGGTASRSHRPPKVPNPYLGRIPLPQPPNPRT